ncbi:Zinc finger protein 997 [Apodemus speciosus]|uniref:Zinc finger protein 997 n=1 Tax=Apodemus speciosus TaxID=105296 RepID=A0ABQ0FGK0_APOSI
MWLNKNCTFLSSGRRRGILYHCTLDAVIYDDVHVSFTEEEWNLLNPSQKRLYKDMMLETYMDLTAIGYNWEDHIEGHCESSRSLERHVRSHSVEKLNESDDECDEALQDPVISNIIKDHILERNFMNVINVVKPLQVTVVSNIIKEHILERNLMNVISVVKPVQVTVVCSIIKENILERNLMNVFNVVKPL